MAAVIRNMAGEAIAAAGFTIPSGKINPTSLDTFSTLVRMGTSLISSKLVYRDTVKTVSSVEEMRDWYKNRRR